MDHEALTLALKDAPDPHASEFIALLRCTLKFTKEKKSCGLLCVKRFVAPKKLLPPNCKAIQCILRILSLGLVSTKQGIGTKTNAVVNNLDIKTLRYFWKLTNRFGICDAGMLSVPGRKKLRQWKRQEMLFYFFLHFWFFSGSMATCQRTPPGQVRARGMFLLQRCLLRLATWCIFLQGLCDGRTQGRGEWTARG
jgi:hypothetical protein